MISELCGTSGAAQLLGVSRTRVLQLMLRGKLEAIPTEPGRRCFVTRASVYKRLAQSPTPPGVQRTVYFARRWVKLTEEKPRDPARVRIPDADVVRAFKLFGSERAEPYRLQIHAAAQEILRVAKLRDWEALEAARLTLYLVWNEFQFTAAPLPVVFPTAKVRPSSQPELFEGAVS